MTPPPDRTSQEGQSPLDVVHGTRRIVSVMGTVFTMDLRDLDPATADVDAVIAWWRWVDATFSTYRPGSQISRLTDGSLSLDACAPEVRHVLGLCDQASAASGGSFTARPGGRLDPSGMVKGWSVEVAHGLLFRAGSRNHCITAGGDVRAAGAPEPGDAWRVGIVDPFDPHRVLAVISPRQESDLAVATSGTAERGPHIINPATGDAASELASVTVVTSDLTMADWMATAAFAMGSDAFAWLARIEGVEAYVVTAEGAHWCTDDFDAVGKIWAEPRVGTGPVDNAWRRSFGLQSQSGERQVSRSTFTA